MKAYTSLGAVLKRCPQSVGKVGVQCGRFVDKVGSSGADVRTFWCKSLRFFTIYGVSARTRGVGPVRTFCGQERRENFSQFCAPERVSAI